MPTFQITGPDGKKYRVSGENAEGALQALQQHLGDAPQAAAEAPQESRGGLMETIEGFTPMGMAKSAYRAVSAPMGALQTLDDTARLAASGLSFGFIDKLAGTTEGGTEAARAKTQAARDRQGVQGAAVEIGSSMLPVGAAVKAGLTATRIPGMVGRVGGMALDGAAYGGLTAAGNDQDVATGALTGAAFGKAGELVGKGIGKAYSSFAPRQAPQSAQEFKKAADRGYTDASESGLVFSKEAFDRIIDDIIAKADEAGIGGPLSNITDDLYKNSSKLVSKLKEMKGKTQPSLEDVEMLKRVMSKAGKGFDADAGLNKQIAKSIKGGIDDAATSDFIAGDVERGVAGIKAGRANWQKKVKTDALEKILENAKDKAGANYTQAGLLTGIRQEAKALKRAKDFTRQWTPEEQKLITQIARGTTVENTFRLAGTLAPRGAITGAIAGGAAMMNPVLGALIAGGGYGGRAVATKMGMNRFNDLMNVVQGAEGAPKLTPAQNERIKEIIRALMMSGTAATVN